MTPLELLYKLQNERNRISEYEVLSPKEQLNLYSKIIHSTPVPDDVIKATIEKYHESYAATRTEQQELSSYSLLRSLFADLEKVIKADVLTEEAKSYINFKPIPVFGTVALSTFSVFLRPAKDISEALIIFSENIFLFANLISKAVALGFKIETTSNGLLSFVSDYNILLEHIGENPQSIVRGVDLLLAHSLLDEPRYTKQYFMSSERPYISNISYLLCKGFELFIVAHEYSHYLLEHDGIKRAVEAIDDDCDEITDNYVNEIVADKLGATLTSAYFMLDGSDTSLSFIGIYLCLHSIELIDKINNLKQGRDEDFYFSDTHPPSRVRRELLIEDIIHNDKKTLELFKIIDFIIEKIWKEFKWCWSAGQEIFGGCLVDKDNALRNFEVVQKLIYRKYGME